MNCKITARVFSLKNILLTFLYVLLCNFVFGSDDIILSQMDAHQLKELGKQKLDQNKYSEVIKIYKELKKKYPNDLIFQVESHSHDTAFLEHELCPYLADSNYFTNFTTVSLHTTIADIKFFKSLYLMTYPDAPFYVINTLIDIYNSDTMLGYYETALTIVNEMRIAYVDNPWDEKIVKDWDFQKKEAVSTGETSESYRTWLDFETRARMANLYEKLGKKQESIVQYQKILSMTNDDTLIGKISVEKRQKIKDDFQKQANDNLKRLQ